MKNKTNKFISGLLLAFALFTGFSAKAAPTCPTIKNSLNCAIVVDIQLYDCNLTPCGPLLGTYTIAPGAVFSINCSACANWCEMKVSISVAGPTSYSPPMTIAMSSTFPGLSFGVSAGVCGSGGSANFFFNPTANQFVVQ